jgi:Flp pilus assembly protein TadD
MTHTPAAIASPDAAVPERRRRVAATLMLVLVTFAVFSPALDADFVEWDDHVNLLQNTSYRGLAWSNIRWMFTATVMGHYIPLTWLTLAVDHALYGMDPRGYHLTSLVLHAANVVTFFAVARRLLARAMTLDASARLLGAAGAALFFAVHPLRAESVAWVTERRDVLSGLFFLLTVLGYLAAQDATTPRRRRMLLTASVAAYAAAVMSKAIVMGLPLVLLVLDVYPLRRLDLRLRSLRQSRDVLVEKIPYAIVGLTGAGVAYYVLHAFTLPTAAQAFPWPGRVAMVFYTLWFYVTRTALPVWLSPLYELPAHVSLAQPRFLFPALAVAGVTVGLVLLRRRWPAGLAAWVCYALILAPVSGVVHAGFQLAHDRYSYLSCLGWALLLGGAAGALAGWSSPLVRGRVRGLALAVVAIWMVGLGWLTWQQVQVWRDSYTLWTFAVDSEPRCAICHGNLAAYLANHNELGGAIHHAERAIALRPDRTRPHLMLGIALTKADRLDEAVGHFERFLAERPDSVDGLSSLGVALLRAGRVREAVGPLHRAASLNPDNVLARVNYAAVLVKLGEREAAMTEYRIVLASDPRSPEARYGTGWAHVQFGETDAARREHAILKTLDAGLAEQLAREIAVIR